MLNKKIDTNLIFILTIFIVGPFIDAINGYMVLNGISREGGAGSIGQLFRMFVLVFSFLLIKRKKHFVILFGMLCYFVVLELVGFLIHTEPSGLTIGLVYTSKIFYFLLIAFCLSELHNQYCHTISKAFKVCIIIYVLVLLVSTILGINSSTYATGMGSKGVFASGNGLSIFLGAASVIFFQSFINERNVKNITFFIFVLFGCVLVGTKASAVFLLLGFLFIIYTLPVYLKIVLFIPVFLVVFYFGANVDFSLFSVFEVIYSRYENSSSILSFLASSRDVFFVDAISLYNVDSFFSLRAIFGLGVFISYRDPTLIHLISYDTLESDLLDVFFMYGLVGILFYLSFWSWIIYRLIVYRHFLYAIAAALVFLYSMVAGHVLFNAMSSTIISYLLYVAIKSKDYS